MKIKIIGIITLVVVIGISVVACDLYDDAEILNGDWDGGDIVITFNNGTAVFTEIYSSSNWKALQNSGAVRIGTTKTKSLSKDGNNKWSGQELCFTIGTTNTHWEKCTITLSGNNLSVVAETAGSRTYTRK